MSNNPGSPEASLKTSVSFTSFNLPLLRARVSLRLLADTTLPAYKGGMLRGGFGFAMQRALCPQPCWQHASTCAVRDRCTYHRIFEAADASPQESLPGLRDAPRAFVLTPPPGEQTAYRAGEMLEFGLTLVGSGADDLAHFILGFAQLGRMGLGRMHTPARLERVEVLEPWQPVGTVVYADGQARRNGPALPRWQVADAYAKAQTLPDTLRLTCRTPLHLKVGGGVLRSLAMPALIQAIGRRLSLLAQTYGHAQEPFDYRALIREAEQLRITDQHMCWDDWRRTSTRGDAPTTMPMGGLVGTAIVHGLSVELRTLLLLGSLVHAGKGATFGLGAIELDRI